MSSICREATVPLSLDPEGGSDETEWGPVCPFVSRVRFVGGEHEASALQGLRYAAEHSDLARFVDSPLDAQIQAIVAQHREALHGSLTPHDWGTLWTYAFRCSVRALRAGDPEVAASGLLALAFLDAQKFDFRDWLIAAGPLAYCLDRTGGDRVAAIEVAIGHAASPATADHLRRFDTRSSSGSSSWWPRPTPVGNSTSSATTTAPTSTRSSEPGSSGTRGSRSTSRRRQGRG